MLTAAPVKQFDLALMSYGIGIFLAGLTLGLVGACYLILGGLSLNDLLAMDHKVAKQLAEPYAFVATAWCWCGASALAAVFLLFGLARAPRSDKYVADR